MDIDRFILSHRPQWERLEALTRRAGRGVGRLSASELDELVQLYQRVSAHLSYIRTYHRDPSLTAHLSGVVARGGAVVYGTRPRTWSAPAVFLGTTFPAAVWQLRWFSVVSGLLLLVPALVVGVWFAQSTTALAVFAPEAVREAYVAEDFEAYYSSRPAAEFATTVTTNNIRVSITAFALGIGLCLPTAAVLVVNGANVGGAAGVFAAAGESARFWGLILPHGLLEITAVVIAGAAGLRIGWTLVDPGDRRRGHALIEEGRRAITVIIGLVLVFLVAGLIEGFVTGSTLPTWARVGVGVLAEVVFLGYIAGRGRAAGAAGLTGALGESEPAGRATAHSRPAAFNRR